MDANGLRFWMLAEQRHWQITSDPPLLAYNRARQSIQLANQRQPAALSDATASGAEAVASSRLEQCPQARDPFETRAYWDGASSRIMATGALPGAVPIFAPPVGEIVTDLALGYDGVLYIAVGGQIVLQDRRDRWSPVTLGAPDFSAWRLAADPAGGVWVLDRTRRKLGRVQGLPLPTRPFKPSSVNTFRPCDEDRDPARLWIVETAVWPVEERPVALDCSTTGRVALLCWVPGADARLRVLEQGTFGPPQSLSGARFPYSLRWVSDDRIAMLLVNAEREAPVYDVIPDVQHLPLVGDFYPLRQHTGEPFTHGLDEPPHYPSTRGTVPLLPLSLPSFATEGQARGEPLDSGSTETVWHRIYLEAAIPANCGVSVWLATSDVFVPPDDPDDWHQHQFGELFAPGDGTTPRGAWLPQPSEIAFHPGLLQCSREHNRSGLFTALIQRSNRRVRTLRGRFLWVRLELRGDGRATPEVAALRAYGSRFSYVNQYLPELYHEMLFGADADALIPAGQPRTSTPADFLERFLDNFEGMLTPLEDRIRSAYLLTDARQTPDEALAWLGSWIGVTFDAAYPTARRRQLLEVAPRLFRQRGTLRGLTLALDTATGGGVRGGEIVILEDFRLRRTFATILGADLADEADPLLGGLTVSGNSYVGDTLFLGDEQRKEFLALFSADLAMDEQEADAIASLFDRLAHRVTVLVHQEIEPQDLGLIRRIVELETPAHVQAQVLRASDAFIVGMAALVGVDSYLGIDPGPGPVKIDRSQLGLRDLLTSLPSLDPRLDGGSYGPPTELPAQRPVASAVTPVEAEFGQSFALDASASSAAPGHTIVSYRWTLTQSSES